jgi:hypothetical protein
MDEPTLSVADARSLGRDVATYSHEDLPADRIEELSSLTEDLSTTVETDPLTAADALLSFWAGHASVEIGTEHAGREDREALFEEAFDSGAVGVDLYQALQKTAAAARTDGEQPELAGWTERLFELTNRHVAHLQTH